MTEFYIDDRAKNGATVDVNAEKGTHWLVFRDDFDVQTTINLAYSTADGQATAAAGLYFIGNMGSRLVVHGVVENARGQSGEDYISGNELDNILYGDKLPVGVGGDDVLEGGEGDDTIYGGAGRDRIDGMEDDDRLYGNSGNDTINGGAGVDRIEGGSGADTMAGGSDIGDTLSYRSSAARVRIEIEYGSTTTGSGGDAQGDKIYGFSDVIGSAQGDIIIDLRKDEIAFNYNKNEFIGGAGNDRLHLGGGDDTGRGDSGADVIYGEQGSDILFGGSGADMLFGGADRDSITGNSGADAIVGGKGADRLNGGADADKFIFFSLSDSGATASTRDRIDDFSRSQGDKIDLSALDAEHGRSGNQAFDFVGARAFSGEEGELRAVASSSGVLVQADVNGDKRADFSLFLDDLGNIRSGDFIL